MAVRNNVKKIVIISPQAKEDLDNILSYLAKNWNQKTVDDFIKKVEIFYYLISINPKMFDYFDKKRNIRKYAITKQNIIYYRNKRNEIQIITVLM